MLKCRIIYFSFFSCSSTLHWYLDAQVYALALWFSMSAFLAECFLYFCFRYIVKKNVPGLKATKIENKIGLRMVQNGDIILKQVFVPDEDRLPGVNSFQDTSKVWCNKTHQWWCVSSIFMHLYIYIEFLITTYCCYNTHAFCKKINCCLKFYLLCNLSMNKTLLHIRPYYLRKQERIFALLQNLKITS